MMLCVSTSNDHRRRIAQYRCAQIKHHRDWNCVEPFSARQLGSLPSRNCDCPSTKMVRIGVTLPRKSHQLPIENPYCPRVRR